MQLKETDKIEIFKITKAGITSTMAMITHQDGGWTAIPYICKMQYPKSNNQVGTGWFTMSFQYLRDILPQDPE